jgi:hypothetical protein
VSGLDLPGEEAAGPQRIDEAVPTLRRELAERRCPVQTVTQLGTLRGATHLFRRARANESIHKARDSEGDLRTSI